MTTPVHGALGAREMAELTLRFPDGIADFGVNTIPYGPAPGVMEALTRATISRYPDQTAAGIRDRWGDALGLSADQIVFGNGGADLIWAVCRAFLGPRSALLTLEPTFSEAGDCAAAMGAPHTSLSLFAEEGSFGHQPLPIPRVLEAIAQSSEEIALVYLCSPNNPTGAAWPEAEIRELEQAIQPARLLLDRSFETLRRDHPIGCAETNASARALFGIEPRPTRVEIRSFTKDFGIPGVRLGAAFGIREDVIRCQRQLTPWCVSAPATMAAGELLEPGVIAHFRKDRSRWWLDMDRTVEGVTTRGLKVLPSTVPFALVHVADGAAARRALLKHGVHVRDCASFGLRSFIRIAGRPAPDRDRLFRALDVLKAEGTLEDVDSTKGTLPDPGTPIRGHAPHSAF